MFCGRAGHLDEFCFRRNRLERKRFEYARNSYRDEFLDFSPHSYSRASSRTSSCIFPSSLMDLTIAHMVLVHERTTLSLDGLVTTHVLIVVIVSRTCLVSCRRVSHLF
jgi:hypothetical protein